MTPQEIDIHQLDRRYAGLRIQDPRSVDRLASSIVRHGQITPVLAVADEQGGRFIVVDGYRRLAALDLLDRDTAIVQVLPCPEDEALFSVLQQGGSRRWAVIEEAGLIQELSSRYGYALREIARRLGRSPSLIKRRLDLITSLPDDILELVLAGTVSSWAASRILVPLARANSEAAKTLAAHLSRQPLSTRQLQRFYAHYQKASRRVRQRMLADPHLFIKSLDYKETSAGPEDEYLREVNAVCGLLARLDRRTQEVFHPEMESTLRRKLLARIGRARSMLIGIQRQIKEQLHHDRTEQRTSDQGVGHHGVQSSSHCQDTARLPQHGEQGPGQQGEPGTPAAALQIRGVDPPDQVAAA